MLCLTTLLSLLFVLFSSSSSIASPLKRDLDSTSTPPASFSCGNGVAERRERLDAAVREGAHLSKRDGYEDYSNWIYSLLEVSQSFETKIVPLHFHLVHANYTAEGGYLPLQSIDAQIEVLNRAFASTGIQFRRETYQYWGNEEWFNGVDLTNGDMLANNLDIAMKKQIHVDHGPGEISWHVGGRMGWARYPSDYLNDPAGDGIVVRYWTFPETGVDSWYATSAGNGMVMVHEMGHSLGLPHTFNTVEGCDPADGDGVADTPVEASAASTDPTTRIGRDTCPLEPGIDPIYNHMDYSIDPKSAFFTFGQIARMQYFTEVWRGIYNTPA